MNACANIMESFTIAYITGRYEPHWEWLLCSLQREADRYGLDEIPRCIVVDSLWTQDRSIHPKAVRTKPNIWQGHHRVTKEQWWAVAASRNTAICLCRTDWICFFDDRCVLMPGYLDALEQAMKDNYVLVGAYEKRERMAVENGVIIKAGFLQAEDTRLTYVTENKIPTPFVCPGSWCFGAIWACPLEWLLEMNGVPEICDGQSFEDVQTGLLLANNGHTLKFDPRAKIIQDRTEGQLGPAYRREDKGRGGPVKEEKGHKLLAMFNKPDAKQAIHTPGWPLDIRKVRADVLSGKPWPIPPKIEYADWYDGQPIKDFI
jgi:hypothetical protein